MGLPGRFPGMKSQLLKKDLDFLWHPYTQMKDYADYELLLIERAKGLLLYDDKGKPYFDTISSWWCILHGHNHPVINAAIRGQLDRLEQVLLAGVTHEPAILLAERLVMATPPALTKVFYSDNGSTACEVALKMSLQYWRLHGQLQRTRFVALERGYHGDTIGAMSLGGVPEFHGPYRDVMFESYRLPSPYCYRCPVNQVPETCALACLAPFAKLLADQAPRIAAIIVEPLIQAAGGMIIYPASYLRELVRMARSHGILVILDEVATGFGRTGTMFAMEQTGVAPDFLCLSKGLTAGYLPMAATLTTEAIYQAFYADYQEGKTFFHGHTFTGNPLAAAAALGSWQVFDEEEPFALLAETIPRLHLRMERFRALPWVGDVRLLGMIAALELVQDTATKEPFPATERVGWRIYKKGLEQGLILRPLGNIIYLWLPISTTIAEIDEITERTYDVLSDITNITGHT